MQNNCETKHFMTKSHARFLVTIEKLFLWEKPILKRHGTQCVFKSLLLFLGGRIGEYDTSAKKTSKGGAVVVLIKRGWNPRNFSH